MPYESARAPLPAVRRRRALEILRRHGSVTCHDVQVLFQVSTATARRDIDSLARHGVAVRVHGGAVLPETITGMRAAPSDVADLRTQFSSSGTPETPPQAFSTWVPMS